MQKITPHLWFDKEALEAADFYSAVFDDSKITHRSTLRDTPSGDSEIVGFTVLGYEFMAISAGPLFEFNPSISFMVNFDPSQDKNARERIDEVWQKLSEGGKALMPLDSYPFSERYGWIQDRYGVSWQLIYTNPEGEERPLVIPSLLFVGDVCGKAEEATDFYLSVFGDSKRGAMARYPAGMEPEKEGTVMFTDFNLEGQWFAAMDSAQAHNFAFNEAVSFMVHCRDQEEIDYYWDKLSAVPEAEQCGWIKDRFGVSWQIVPENMGELLSKNPAETTPVMLKMKKIIVADLVKAAAGSPSRLIDARIKELPDWQGEVLSRIRRLIKQAVPDVVEEVKWRKPSNSMSGVPVWSYDGIICTGETYKKVVKLTFVRGASLEDPAALFNASLKGNTRRAIDLHEGDEIDESAFKSLVRAAAALNTSSRR